MEKENEIFFDDKKYISLKQASNISGYAKDYIGQLCRGGKVNARRLGRDWFVDYHSLISYKLDVHGGSNINEDHEIVEKNQTQETLITKNTIEKGAQQIKANISAKPAQKSWTNKISGIRNKGAAFFRKEPKEKLMPEISKSEVVEKKILPPLELPRESTSHKAKELLKSFFTRISNITPPRLYIIERIKRLKNRATQFPPLRAVLEKYPSLKKPKTIAINLILFLIVGLILLNNPAIVSAVYDELAFLVGNAYAQIVYGVSWVSNGISGVVSSSSGIFGSITTDPPPYSGDGGAFPLYVSDLVELTHNKIKSLIKETNRISKSGLIFASNSVRSFFTGAKDIVFGIFKKEAPTLVESEVGVQIPEGVGKEVSDEEVLSGVLTKDDLLQLQHAIVKDLSEKGLVVETIIEKPTIIERTVERIISGLSTADLDSRLVTFNTDILSRIDSLKNEIASRSQANFNAIALTNKIDNLVDSQISNDITVSNYLALSGGTISGNLTITGTCTGCGSGVSDWQKESNYGVLTLTPTTTIPVWFKDAIYASSTLTVQGDTSLANFTAQNATITSATTTNLFTSNFTLGSITGFLKATAGAVATALIDLANDVTGILTASNGGTGTSTAPTADQILIGGDTAGRYDVKTLTAGSNITFATSSGLFTISSSGGGSGTFAWTPSTTYGENTSATSTPLWLQDTLYASSTSFFTGLATFTYASTTAISGGGQDLTLARIDGSTFSTIQDLQNIFHSAGWITGGGITDDADGTITVAAGTGLIRGVDGTTETIFFTNWLAEAGANVNLTDNSINYIYVEYNSGSPQVIATITKRTDFQTNVLLGVIAREGTTLHINTEDKFVVGDHAADMIRRVKDVAPFAHVSGAIISATGTRGVNLTAGSFWQGLTEFSTASFDSASSDTFTYFFRDGSGGFTAQANNATIDNLAYDDNSGATTTLSNNKYGVHWVYLEVDDDISVLYGQGNYTLAQAEDAQPPASVPNRINTHGFLIGKIIIKKSNAAFTQTESAFETTFAGSLAQDHGNLAGLTDDDHAQYLLADGTRALSADWGAGGFDISNIGKLTVTNASTTQLTVSSNLFTSLTQNSIPFIGADGLLSENTSNFIWDDTNARLGIGTSTPYAKLTVWSSGTSGAAVFEVVDSASTTLFTVLSSGNLGIGTTSPYAKLSVVGQVVAEYFTATSTTATTTLAGMLNVGSGNLVVLNNGNVGIGTAAPMYPLHINGGAFLDNNSALWGEGASGVIQRMIQVDASDNLLFGDSDTDRIIFYSEGDELARFEQGTHNFGIGTTSPWAKLSVEHNAGEVAFAVGSSTATSFIIDANGRVGIGITNPDGTLHVMTSSAGSVTANTVAGDLIVESGGTTGISILSPSALSSLLVLGSPADSLGAAIRWQHSAALMRIGSSAINGQVAIESGLSIEAIRIDASQRVGIGTSTPYAKLTVWASGTSGASIFNVVDTSSTTLFTVLDSGNVGIGTTSPYASLSVTGNLAVTASTTFNDVEYLFPGSDGTSGQALTTNSAGGLTWTTISGGSGTFAWTPSTTYGENTSATTTPLWLQDTLYASSTSFFTGLATFSNATATQLTVTGPAYFDSTTRMNNVTYTWPGSDGGTAGQVLSTNSAGQLSWSDVSGGISPSFSVHKNGSAQADVAHAIFTKLTWSTEYFDTNNDFADSTFTPTVAGKYLLTASARILAMGNADVVWVVIYKNGAQHISGSRVATGLENDSPVSTVTAVVDANGTTDYFEAWIYHTYGSNRDVYGSNANFSGSRIDGGGLWTDGGDTSYLATSDRVGIGTSTAYAKLTVWATSTTPTVFNVVDSASTTLFTVLSSGNVGIGTTSPYAKLSVVGEVVAEYFTATSTSATSTFAGGLNVGSGGLVYDHQTGFVGIGTAEPDSKLHVLGDILVQNNGRLLVDGTGDLAIGNTDGGAFKVGGNGATSIMSASFNDLKYRWFRTDTTTQKITFTGSNSAGEVEYFRVQGHTDSNNMETVFNEGGVDADFRVEGVGQVNALFVEGSSGNVGIGTTSPYARLSVEHNAGEVAFAVGSSTATSFIIDANGRVGIGITNPDGTLHVMTASAGDVTVDAGADELVVETNTNGGVTILTPNSKLGRYAFGSPTDSLGAYLSWKYNNLELALNTDTAGGFLTFGTDNAVEAIRIDASQRVGIGTSTPYAKLTVWANGTSGASVFNVVDTSSTTLFTVLDSGNVGIGTSSPFTDLSIAGSLAVTGTTTFNDVGYAWPGSDGSNAQVLTTDSAGGLSWSTLQTGTSISPSFIVHRNGSSTTTPNGPIGMDWTTESFDTNNDFNLTNDRFQPSVAGKYLLTASIQYGSILTDKFVVTHIYKNGVVYASGLKVRTGTTVSQSSVVTTIVDANGTTDYFEVYTQNDDSANETIQGETEWTYFTGSRIDGGGLWTDGGDTSYLATDDRVGIGTSTAYAKLTVWATSTTPTVFNVVDSASTTLFTVLSSGNVGIGTSSPFTDLSVAGSLAVTGTTTFNDVGYAWPGADGSNAQVLTTDSAGGLSWSTLQTGTSISPSFSVHKGGTDQTSVPTNTKITWNTEEFDTNNDFSTTSDRFQPSVAGKYLLTASVQLSTMSTNDRLQAILYKNGSSYKSGSMVTSGAAGAARSVVSVIVDANGTTDYFEVYVGHIDSPDPDVRGLTHVTYFTGSRIDGGGLWTDGGTTSYLATSDRIGIGTSTAYAKLTVWATSTTATVFNVVDSASTTLFTVLSSGNVGIGTSSPYARLSVVGEVVAEYFTATSTIATTTLAGMLNVGSGNLVVLNNGNVGIGTVAPNYKLEVNGTANGFRSVADSTGVQFRLTENTGYKNVDFKVNASGNLGIIGAGSNNVNLGIGTTSPWAKLSVEHNAGEVAFAVGSSTATSFIIDADGNVGIGTTNPDGTLHIMTASAGDVTADTAGDDLVVENDDDGGITILTPGDKIGGVYFGKPTSPSRGAILFDHAGNKIKLNVNQSTKVTIDGFGNLGIGTTSPYAKLSVVGQVVGEYFTATSTSATSTFAGGLTVGSNIFVVDPDSGRVGIGIKSPNEALHILGSAVGLRLKLQNTQSNSFTSIDLANDARTWQIRADNDDTFKIRDITGGEFRMTIDTSGNLGIGTTSPWAKLSVEHNAGEVAFAVGSSTATSFIIDADGNVGIGTDNPSSKLQVNALLSGSSIAFFRDDALFADLTLVAISGAFELLSGSGDQLQLSSNGVSNNGIRIGVSGNVGIGTTSPLAKLEVNGDFRVGEGANYNGLFVDASLGRVGIGTAAPSAKLEISAGNLRTSGTNSQGIEFYRGGAEIGSITTASNKLTLNVGAGGSGIAADNNVDNSAITPYSAVPNMSFGNLNATDGTHIPIHFTFTGGEVGIMDIERPSDNNVNFRFGFRTSITGDFVEKFRIQSDGNIGIGTTSPYAKLSVVGEIVGAYFTGTTTATSTLAGGLNVFAINQTGSATSTFANGIQLTSGCFLLPSGECAGTGGGGGAFTSAGGLTYLSTITDNVGIGTSTPYAKLTVWGGGEGTNTAFEVINNSSTTLFSILENGKITLGGTTNGLVLHNISSNPSSPSLGELYFNSTDNKAYIYNGSSWVDLTASSSGTTAFGAYQNLVASSTAGADTTQVTITADYLTLIDPSDSVFQAVNVNVTADITASGANGLDTGSEASGTWYYVWIIYNNSTVASLLSTSATDPTMPAGYTYKRLISAVRNDGSSNFLAYKQYDEDVWYAARQQIATSLSATSYATQDVSALIPTVSNRAKMVLFGANSSTGNAQVWLSTDGTNAKTHFSATNITSDIGETWELYWANFGVPIFHPLSGNNIYYKVDANSITLYARAYTFSLKEKAVIGSGSASASSKVLPSAQFIYNSTSAIKLSGAGYYLDGVGTVSWASELTYTFGSGGSNADSDDLAVSDWFYLYLDYSSISDPGTITTANLVNSSTAPTWSDSKYGWYNGNDKAIFAVRTDGSSNILEFFHDGGDYVSYATYIQDGTTVDVDDTWIDVTLTIPSFSTKAYVGFEGPSLPTSSELSWRTNGQTDSTGHRITARTALNTDDVIVMTDGVQIIEWKTNNVQNNTYNLYTNGWYFPKGMQGNTASGGNIAGGGFTDDGTSVRLTTITDKLGIGTSSPYAKLTVWADGISGASAFNVVDSASTTLFTVLSSGNVGIGTTSPYAKLSVVGEIVGAYFTGTTTATSTLAGGLNVFAINQTGGATSTFANGIQLTGGCYLLADGTCAGSGGGVSIGSAVTSGTSGSVLFVDSSNNLAQNNSNFYWDDTNARLGIGTTSPYAKLTIWANGTSGASVFEVVDSASTTLFTVLDSGNVGIGTTSPWANLSINQDAGEVAFIVGSSTATSFIIDANGYVGIGSTSPTEQLSVANRIYVGGTGTSTFENNLHVLGTLQIGTGSTYITESGINTPTLAVTGATTFNGLAFSFPTTAGGEVLTTDSEGNLIWFTDGASTTIETTDTDFDAGTHSNTTVNGTGGSAGVEMTAAANVFVSRTEGTVIGDMTGYGGLAAAFDGSTSQSFGSGAFKASAGFGIVGKDWGAGNEKYINGFQIWSSNNRGFWENFSSTVNVTLQGSNTSATAGFVNLGSVSGNDSFSGTKTFSKLSGITMTTAYRWHRLYTSRSLAHNMYVAEVKFYEFFATGTFTSQTIDTGATAAFSTLDYNITTPTDTSMTIDIRAGTTSDLSWISWQTGISDGGDITTWSGNRYVQYRINFTRSNDTSNTASLDDITINYVATKTLIASGLISIEGAGTSTFSGGIDVLVINQTGSATSTFANGIQLTSGCFLLPSGECAGTGGGGGAFTSAGGLTYLSTITDNVGIGTSTPYAKLTVWGGGEGTNTAFEVVNNSSTTLFSILENGKITLGGTTNGLVLHNISSNPSSPSLGELYFNSTDNKAYVYNGSSWVDLTASSSGATAFGAYQNLVASSTAGADTTQVTITADYLTLIDPSDSVYQASNVNVTADITASGVNGLDTGSEASDTWYYVWIIYNNSTVASLLSTSATDPTMPSGYTYKRLVSAVRNDGSSNFLAYKQLDEDVWYAARQQIATSLSATSYTTQDVSALFPTASNRAKMVLFGFTGSANIQVFLSDDGTNAKVVGAATNISNAIGQVNELYWQGGGGESQIIPLDGNNVYYKVSSGSITLYARAYTFSLKEKAVNGTASSLFAQSGNDIYRVLGNVGFGTTSPYAKLTVWADGTSGASAFAVIDSASTTLFTVLSSGNVGIGTTSPWANLSIEQNAGEVAFVVGSSTATSFIIDADGRVGIGTISINAVLDIDKAISDHSRYFEVGDVDSGSLIVWRDDTVAGNILLNIVGEQVLWVDSAGDWRTAPAFPSTDTSGTVLGDQSSSLDSKNITGEFLDYRGALNEILNAPLYNFTYKSGSYNNEQFTGIITDYSPIFGKDIDIDHPYGKSLNEVTAFGYTFGAIKQMNQIIDLSSATTSSPSMYIDSTGNIGIGTTSPQYKLHVAGDVAATGFINLSTRDAKSDIVYLNGVDDDYILDKIKNTNTATYYYNDEECNYGGSTSIVTASSSDKWTYTKEVESKTQDLKPITCQKRLGLIAEEAPLEILSADGKGVDLYKMSTFLWSGMKAQQTEIEDMQLAITDLQSKIANLEVKPPSGEWTYVKGEPLEASGDLMSWMIEEFKQIGVWFEDGITKLVKLFVSEITITKNSAGISTIGSAIISSGDIGAYIETPVFYPNSKVFVTFTSPLQGRSWFISEKTDGKFRVVLSQSASQDISFDYWIVQTDELMPTGNLIATTTPVEITQGTSTLADIITLDDNIGQATTTTEIITDTTSTTATIIDDSTGVVATSTQETLITEIIATTTADAIIDVFEDITSSTTTSATTTALAI